MSSTKIMLIPILDIKRRDKTMELFAKPGVAGIIENNINGIDYVLIQERFKEDAKKEEGLIEIPAGKIREFENIFDTLRREIREETGLEVVEIKGENNISIFQSNDYKVLNYMPFACSQNLHGDYPIMVQTFICTAEGEILKNTNETKNIRWVPLTELKEMLDSDENSFYPMHVITLEKYLEEKININDKVCIRKAAKSDAKALIEYLNTIGGESDFLTFGPGQISTSIQQEEEFISSALNNENALFIIAEINGKLVGNLNFSGGPRQRTSHVGEFGVSVLKEYWGNGIGEELIKYLINWSRNSGIIRKINLRVRTDNTSAISLYKKLGFLEEGILKRDFLIDGNFYDSLSMGMCIN